MDYEIGWLVENRVIHVTLGNVITVDMANALSDNIIAYIEISDAPYVHLIIDDKNLRTIPKQIDALMKGAKVLWHSRLGWFILYGSDNKVFKFIAQMFSRMLKLRHRRFQTREEAFAFLQTVDTTLPNLNASQS
jgi:hypothetical protein